MKRPTKTAVDRGNRMSEMRESERQKDKKTSKVAPKDAAPMTSLRPKKRPDTVDVSPNAEAKDQEHVKKFRAGGMVGCSDAQVKGTKFSGTY